jgi:TetR/AcrR family transcriptional regulator
MSAGETKADRTRRRILAAAEAHFAEHGFHGARLEDIAADVGIRRAAVFYHFRDKRALHEAVLHDAVDSVLARVQEILARELPFAARAERAAQAWVVQAEERPACARLLLREAGSGEVDWRHVAPLAAPFLAWMRHELEEAAASGEIDPVTREPLRVVGALAGAGVFDPASDEPGPARQRAAAALTRRLLGAPGGR